MRLLSQKINALAAKIEWVNFSFIVLTPIAAIAGTVWLVRNHGGPHGATLLLLGAMMLLTGFGITAGYHRLFSHCSYQANRWVQLLLILFGGASFEGSVREWCCAHRKHHRHVDQEKDPYNIRKGFWHAHVLWVILKSDQSDVSNIKDLLSDRLVRWQGRYYIPLAVAVGFALPTAIASLWGDPWGGFFIAGVSRVVINHHLTFLINSYCHFFGKQHYSDRDSARDSWLMAFFTYGEGYQNFHHAFQTDYRNGVWAYQWDPTKWLINILRGLRLTWDLKRVGPERILAAKLQMDEKRLRMRTPRYIMLSEEWGQLLAKTRTNIEQVSARFTQLRLEYRQLKKTRMAPMQEKMLELRHEMRIAKREFKQALAQWRWLCKSRSVIAG